MNPLLGTRTAATAFLAVGLLGGLTACGDDTSPAVADEPSSATPTPTPTPTSTPTPEPAGTVIPDDFPLLDGYPTNNQSEGGDNGRHGPSRELDPLRFAACGSKLPLPEVTDQLRGGWTNPEDYRERQLSTFGSVDAAEAFVGDIEGLYAACSTEDTEDGYTRVNEIVAGSLGDYAFTHVRRYELDGAPAIGLATTTVVRVGRAVLVSATYNEGGGGPDPQQEVTDAAKQGEEAIEALVPQLPA
ncbi:hypothetical protein [Nocardioides sp.]|uniref:hypothetical protein n=1 Tax=Nocardioides sp. TaxID=35761 RepID=UPI0031FE9BD7|nr:hypothetical protein [Nocardioides sp.]